MQRTNAIALKNTNGDATWHHLLFHKDSEFDGFMRVLKHGVEQAKEFRAMVDRQKTRLSHSFATFFDIRLVTPMENYALMELGMIENNLDSGAPLSADAVVETLELIGVLEGQIQQRLDAIQRRDR